MRQYRILFRRAGSAPGLWATLRPIVNASLYNRPEINAEIERIRTTPYLKAVSLQLDDEAFNIVSFEQDAEAPQAFKFEEPTPVAT